MCAHPYQCRHRREVWKGYTEMRQESNWGRSYSCSQIIYLHIIRWQRRFKGCHNKYSTKQGKKTNEEGFPGGSAVKNLLCNARDTGSIPGPGGCHMPQATKPVRHHHWASTLELETHNYWAHGLQLLKPKCLELVLHNKGSLCNEKPTHCKEEEPLLAATRGSPHTATNTHHSQQINK